ncbi:hypothetical protein QBC44DRAFT_367624 [Cladorrhinum sp. PSN332]|nr:hypothetical protein QBC44DRAFT_367624 [Cladorrhinum sp. PSN332]
MRGSGKPSGDGKHRVSDEIKDALGVSRNYQGDVFNKHNLSATIPPEQSRSLWLENLPPFTTVKNLLDVVLRTSVGHDRIYATTINGPEPKKGKFGAAGKIVTFTRAAAKRLFDYIRAGNMIVDGWPVQVRWHRHLVAEQDLPRQLTRTLIIEGHHQVANLDFLRQFLSFCEVEYQEQHAKVELSSNHPEWLVITWVFGSYRAQVAAAVALIQKKIPVLIVDFGPDPCDW